MIDRVKAIIPQHYFPAVRKFYWWLQDQKLYRWFCALPYIGNRVYCPCCDNHFHRFIPYGFTQRGPDGPTRNSRCPGCGYIDRHRLLWLYIQSHTNIFSDRLKILHFAPEAIIQKKLRSCSNLDYTSADLNSPLAMITLDITNIPYAQSSFDVILCSHVLEHIPDDVTAISELYRILKPDGWALILVPFNAERAETFEDASIVDPKERSRLFGQYDHVRVYGRDFVARLQHAGFTVHQEFYVRELGPALAQRCGLHTELDMFYCTR
jgi:SAM-dependent methyltransferase